MANYAQTTKYLLRKILGTSDVKDVDEGFASLADDIDGLMTGRGSGTLAARPAAARDGFLYRTTDTGQVFMDTGSSWIEIGVSPWMPGDLKATWLTAAPAGWLMGDGSAVSRATYAALFAAIGTSAGAGNGTTTFNVPDFRGRVFVMPDGSGGRLSGNDARGQSGGEEFHALSVAEMPSHDHGGAATNGSQWFVLDVAGGLFVAGSGVRQGAGSGMSAAIPAQGGGAAHNTMQPYLVGGGVLVKT